MQVVKHLDVSGSLEMLPLKQTGGRQQFNIESGDSDDRKNQHWVLGGECHYRLSSMPVRG